MLDGTSWRLTLDVGREPGTWMPKEWAASGATLTLPIEVTFTDEVLPGDGGFFDPDRDQHPAVDEIRVSANKRMRTSAGLFAGTEGAVVVNITAGAWATWPTGRCGEHRVRFYLDFPDGAQLKDVSIPAGRMYFDTARGPGAEVAAPEPPLPASRPARRPLPPQDLCRLRAPQACWDGGELRDAKAKSRATEDRLEALLSEADESDARAAQADAGASVLERAQIARDQLLRDKAINDLQWELDALSRAMPERVASIAAPKGNRLAAGGGLSIKGEDGLLNMWGLLGGTYYILGRFTTEVPIGAVPYPQFPADWEGKPAV